MPGDFDTSTFLATAKTQFREIQAVWDSGDLAKLRDYMTDDLIAEVKPEIVAREDKNATEVVLLNTELLGIEAVRSEKQQSELQSIMRMSYAVFCWKKYRKRIRKKA